ncbi:MAG: glycosyltransferase [Sporichthyaceae bacterium]
MTQGHHVTAVLISHNGERWLPQVLAGLTAQTQAPVRVLCADTGSTDSSPALITAATGSVPLALAPSTGYGAAIGAVLREVPADTGTEREWLWLLHDDSEPEPEALAQLLIAVEADPSLAIVGPKVRGWYKRRVLLEVGVSIDAGGRRETDLERGEQDQGQHDQRRSALAVSSAGMLVRRDVWDALGGFDPYLPLMRDDVDLCWRAWLAGHKVAVVPSAVIYHAEASAASRRVVHIGTGRVHLLDRAGALRVLLANLPTLAVVMAVPRLLLGCLARAVGYLLAKLPGYAADELRAAGAVLIRPRAVRRMRAARRVDHHVDPRSLRRLFPRPGHQISQGLDALRGVAAGRRTESAAIGGHRVRESGPVAEDAENIERGAGGVLARRLVRSIPAMLAVALVLVALLAGRDLLGGGRLLGGAMLPAPDGAGALWDSYLGSWSDQGLGSADASPPYLALLAMLATLGLGSADLALTLVLLGSVPLAGLLVYLVGSTLPTSRPLRAWAAVAYASAPVLTGAIAAGRVGSAAAIALLPLVVLSAVRVVGTPARPGTNRAAWAGALALTVVGALAPLTWVLAVIAALAILALARLRVVRIGSGRADERALLARLAIALGVPVVALMPWSLEIVTDPSRLFGEPGLPGPGLAEDSWDTWRLVLLDPGGPGSVPGLVGAAIVFAGFAGVALARRPAGPAVGIAGAVVAYLVALVASRFEVAAPVGGAAAPIWPGVALALAALCLLSAAAVGLHTLGTRLAARDFGVAQLLAGAVALLALGSPVVAAATWMASGAGDPLRRDSAPLVPAFVAAEAGTQDRPRTLVLRSRETGADPQEDFADLEASEELAVTGLSYALVRGSGPQLGDADRGVPPAAVRALESLVADLVSGRGDAQAERLVDFGVRFVLVRSPIDDDIARGLDAVPALERVSTAGGDGLWRLQIPVARLMVVSSGSTQRVPLASDAVSADVDLPPQTPAGFLTLAEPADGHWSAEVDGRELRGLQRAGWAQAFELPAGGGRLELRWSDPVRGVWMFSQAVLVLGVVVLALPGGSRRRPDDGGEEDERSVVAESTSPRRRRAPRVDQ